MRRLGRGFATGMLAASSLLACQLIVGVRDEDGVRRPEDGGADANATIDPCVKHRPPPPPELPIGVDPVGPRFFAVRSFAFRPPAAPPIGYDLDDRCTGSATSTTREAPCASSKGTDVGDDDGGVDNAFGRLLDGLRGIASSDAGDFVAESFGENIERGSATLLVQVTGWNQEANDPQVWVSILPATGLAVAGCSDEDASAGPRWDGCDEWSIAESIPIVNDVAVEQIAGYVANDELVAVTTDRQLTFGLGPTSFGLHHPIITASIVRERDNGPISLRRGMVTGRAPARGLIDLVRHIDSDDIPICQNPTLNPLVQSLVCGARDVPLNPLDDGRGLACDAVSFAFGFEAFPARLGQKVALPPIDCPESTGCPE